MAIQASTVWRVRVNGLDTNGGAYDPLIAGAGTDYSDQDAAQLALIDLSTSGASANITSASGGFTAAMVGNAMQIASGTNFTPGTYFIAAVASSNAATLDRVCSTAAASAGVAKVGGAHLTLNRALVQGSVAGNTIMVRGQGSNNPVDIDYPTSALLSISSVPSETTWQGYNGRPKVGHVGGLFYGGAGYTVRNFYLTQTSATYTNLGAIQAGGSNVKAVDCVIDAGGFDTVLASFVTLVNCTLLNTGAQTPGGTNPGVIMGSVSDPYSQGMVRCIVKDLRGPGVVMYGGKAMMIGNAVANCGGDGIRLYGPSSWVHGLASIGNTIYGNAGHGIALMNAAANTCMFTESIIAGHVGSGKYGLYQGVSQTYPRKAAWGVQKNNFYGNTTNSNIALDATDLTLDPQFVSPPLNLTPTNTALRFIGGLGAY